MSGMGAEAGFIRAEWPAPECVRAVCTTRLGGFSAAPFDSLNLGGHVGDDPVLVARNRAAVRRALDLPSDPAWLEQVHGVQVVDLAGLSPGPDVGALCVDASVARGAGAVCVVMTADCLPVLFCDRSGHRVAAAHAGWRGLSAGVLEQTIQAMGVRPEDLMAWMGPAIGPDAFEVGDEVREQFVSADPGAAAAFEPGAAPAKWMADIYALARRRLRRAGVGEVYGGGFCTVTDADRFFSYRRDGRTGRMASLVWIR